MSCSNEPSYPFLETSACSRLTLSNLLGEPLSDMKGKFQPVSAQLSRQILPLDLVPTVHEENLEPLWVRPDLPQRPASQLPPSRQLEMRASLGEYRGSGRVGLVFALENLEVVNMPRGFSLPPLVAKIGRLDRAASLAREAWFYDEMECIQGSVVPRCYGWFQFQLSSQSHVPVLDHFVIDLEGEDTEDDSACLQDSGELNDGKPLHPMLKGLLRVRDILSVLVLEEVGHRLTIGRRISKEENADIHELYTQFAHLGIAVSMDICWENLAMKHPSVPNRTSPLIKRQHAFRLIDFDQAFKVDWSLILFRINTSPDVTQLLTNIRHSDCGPDFYSRANLVDFKRQKTASANDCFTT